MNHHTEPIWLLEMYPPTLPSRHYTWHARVRLLLAGFLASTFVADVKSRVHVIPEAVGALFVVYLCVVVLRGLVVVAEIAGVR